MQKAFEKVLEVAKDAIGPLIEKGVEELGKKALDLMKEFSEKLWEFVSDLLSAESTPDNVKYFEQEFFSQADLLKIAKENRVPGSNGIFTQIRKKDDASEIVMTFLKDSDVIPEDQNVFLVFKADNFSKDIIKMFNGHEYIILR